jgi:hypothetical protein
MGKKIDLTGQRFGRLVVIREWGQNKKGVLWQCKCDCMNYKIANAYILRKGIIKHCGCLKVPGRRILDLTGQRFGKLTVDKICGRNKRGVLIRLCRCDCGNYTKLTLGEIRGNISCGCTRKRKWNKVGQKFGKLTVIKKLYPDKNRNMLWQCKCSCGKEKEVDSDRLIQGRVISCGCIKRGRKRKKLASYNDGFTEIMPRLCTL